MAYSYLSYWHESVESAYALRGELETAGFSVWANPDPAAGASWHPVLENFLRGAWVAIPLLTPAAVAAPLLAAEWAYAWGAGIPVIPVRLEPVELHPYLESLDPIPFDGSAGPLLERLHALARMRCASLPADAPPAVFAAADAVCSPDPAARMEAVRDLAGLDHPAAQAVLRWAAVHPAYIDVRRAAVEQLGRDPGDVPDLVAALDDADDAIIRAAAASLARTGTAAIPALEVALWDGSRMARRGAILALAQIGGPEAVPGLIAALSIPDWHVSRAAAVALGRSGDRRAVEALTAAQSSEDSHLRDLAGEALARLGA